MATKIPTINQHIPLHELYPDNCCLCKAESEISRLKARIAELENKLLNREKIIEVYKDYVVLLGLELDEMVPMMSAHGWKSSRYEQGEALREKITELEADEKVKTC